MEYLLYDIVYIYNDNIIIMYFLNNIMEIIIKISWTFYSLHFKNGTKFWT